MQTCKKCGEHKPVDMFALSSREAGGKKYRRTSCRDCLRVNGPAYQRKYRYGMTEERFQEMIQAQSGKCAICATSEPGDSRDWRVDHDHSCCPGKRSCGNCVRALLCDGCNKGIGHFKDSPDALMAAAAYLLQRTNVLEEL